MTREIPELLLIDAACNYRERFESRVAELTPREQADVARAIFDCANSLSKYLKRMPDNVIFGREVFTRDQADRLVSRLREMLDFAHHRRFEAGITAIIALLAVATLVKLRHEATFSSTRDRRERELTRMGRHMEKLIKIQRGDAS